LAVSFVYGKEEEYYIWSLRQLKRQRVTVKVFIVDGEVAESNAIRAVYPDAMIILCRWHVFEAIQRNCNTPERISSDEDWALFKSGCYSVIDAPTPADFVTEWNKFSTAWSKSETQCDAVDYVKRQWLRYGRKTALCKAFFPDTPFFGVLWSTL